MNLTKKYRPKHLDEVVGQHNIVAMLRPDLEKRDPASFYLNYGYPGTGKTTLARLSALYLNCSESTDSPCKECANCKAILDGSFAELREVNGADLTGIDDSRTLKKQLHYAVGKGKYRVVVMDECHRLSKQAWDLCLKPLEEGFKNTVFFFCTTEIDKVPKAIRSRAVNQGFYFNQVDHTESLRILKAIARLEGIKAADKDLERLAIDAGGSVRDAINSLSSFYNAGEVDSDIIRKDYEGVDPQDCIKLYGLLRAKRLNDAYWIVSAWGKAGLNPTQIHTILLEHCANLLMSFSLKHRGWDAGEVKKAQAQRKAFGEILIGEMLDNLMESQKYLKFAAYGYSVQNNLILGRLYSCINRVSPQKTYISKPVTKVSDREIAKEGAEPDEVSTADYPSEDTLANIAKKAGGVLTKYDPVKGSILFIGGKSWSVLEKHVTGRNVILLSDVPSLAIATDVGSYFN